MTWRCRPTVAATGVTHEAGRLEATGLDGLVSRGATEASTSPKEGRSALELTQRPAEAALLGSRGSQVLQCPGLAPWQSRLGVGGAVQHRHAAREKLHPTAVRLRPIGTILFAGPQPCFPPYLLPRKPRWTGSRHCSRSAAPARPRSAVYLFVHKTKPPTSTCVDPQLSGAVWLWMRS